MGVGQATVDRGCNPGADAWVVASLLPQTHDAAFNFPPPIVRVACDAPIVRVAHSGVEA